MRIPAAFLLALPLLLGACSDDGGRDVAPSAGPDIPQAGSDAPDPSGYAVVGEDVYPQARAKHMYWLEPTDPKERRYRQGKALTLEERAQVCALPKLCREVLVEVNTGEHSTHSVGGRLGSGESPASQRSARAAEDSSSARRGAGRFRAMLNECEVPSS